MGVQAAQEIQKRVNELVSQMTLEEKVSQMVYNAPAIERLGIPAHNWWNEGLHGLGRAGLATVFPQAIGLAATWDTELMLKVASIISDEARAKHHAAARLNIRQIYSGLTFWSPNINIFRDPRWGRGQETYGEDPYLTACMGTAFIKGLQGNDPDYLKLVATPKHYAVHSGPEPDRHHFDAVVDEWEMREFYLFAFEACIKEAKAASIMGAYNRVNGEPACASPTLLEKILRQEWGFEGYVVSDCEAIRDIFENHKVVETAEEAAALAVKHGCELNCGGVYSALLRAVEQGLITEEEIDIAVERLFNARFRLGMFDAPEQVPYTQIPYDVIDSAAHRMAALEAARASIVLLKNENKLLPLSKDIGSIAVIGPNADDALVMLGNYNGTPSAPITPLEGIRNKVSSSTTVHYAQGCQIAEGMPVLEIIPPDYLHPLDGETGQAGLSATYYNDIEFTGEPALSRIDEEIDFIWRDTSPISGQWGEQFCARWEGTLVPPVSGTYQLGANGYSEYRLYLDDELLTASSFIHHPLRQIEEVELVAGQTYRIRLELINEGLDPQIQLLWSVPAQNNYVEEAINAAKQSDVVVMVMGISAYLEGEEMPIYPDVEGFAGGDRTSIQLPPSQINLMQQVSELGKPVVLVLMNGSALAVSWADEHIPAIVDAWYPGQAGGEAIADVLFGDYNPGGKLPVTVYKSIADLPPFDEYHLIGQTYRYFTGEPLYPFGYGLSYTTFELSELSINPGRVRIGDQVEFSMTISNTGELAGDEVVQLYIRQPESRSLKELKGFKRITLRPGETRQVTFSLHTAQLGIYDDQMRYMVQPQIVDVMIGSSSAHNPLTGSIEIVGEPEDMGAEKVFFSVVAVK